MTLMFLSLGTDDELNAEQTPGPVCECGFTVGLVVVVQVFTDAVHFACTMK